MKIFHKENLQVIEMADERFYLDEKTGGYFPSVTTILDIYPKGYGYIQWLKDLGANSDEVVKRAAEQGTNVHDAIHKYITGEEVAWTSEEKENYTLEEWLMILKFVDFYKNFNPRIIATEVSMVDSELGFGGTIDCVCYIGDELWLIDFKTGNSIHKSNKIQVSAYQKMWNKNNKEQIKRVGCMHFKATTRGADKTGKTIQGEGWKIDEVEDIEHLYKLFEHAQVIWKEENPNPKPKNLVYPDRIKI